MLIDCRDFDQMRYDFVAWLSAVNKAASSNHHQDSSVPVDAQLEAIKARAELHIDPSIIYQAECTSFLVTYFTAVMFCDSSVNFSVPLNATQKPGYSLIHRCRSQVSKTQAVWLFLVASQDNIRLLCEWQVWSIV